MNQNLDKAIELIKKFEGFKTKAYKCPAGVLTIGYGTTIYKDGSKVKKDDYCDESGATFMLQYECEKLALRITDLCHPTELSNNELCALVSLVYNIGIGNFQKSTLLKNIQKKNDYGLKLMKDWKQECEFQFTRWNKSKGKALKGLTARRKAEKELFLMPEFRGEKE